MSQIYTIDEILLAVDEIQNKKKVKTSFSSKKIDLKKKDHSEIPKNTLKLIEEAEEAK
tara:strand:+ start:2433 stop:2606 length:174 start_codon:yes stop_codon:yes gene_type:complete